MITITVQDQANNLVGYAVTDVSEQPGNQTDGTIAVDPLDSSHVMAVASEEGRGLLISASTDGGTNWTQTTIAAGGSDGLPIAGGQPQATFDQFGNFYLTYIDQTEQNLIVATSSDFGQTFTLLQSFFSSDGVSRPVLATGPGPAAPSSIWLAYLQGSQIMVAGTEGDSLGVVGTFDSPRVVLTGSSGTTPYLGGLAVGPLGQVLVSSNPKMSPRELRRFMPSLNPTGLSGSFGPALRSLPPRTSADRMPFPRNGPHDRQGRRLGLGSQWRCKQWSGLSRLHRHIDAWE